MKTRRFRTGQSALDYQPLESRRALSATGFHSADTTPSAPTFTKLAFQEQSAPAEIPYLVLRINDRVKTVNGDELLLLERGDRLGVIAVGVRSELDQGVFAAEGYINKLTDDVSPSSTDHNDGRFSARDNNFTANGSGGEIGGLQGDWTIDEGWDRLTVTLLHYTADGAENVASFQLRLQVEVADFQFDTSLIDRWAEQTFTVGDALEIPGVWSNQGGGVHHNYAEADVFDMENGERIVWAGALDGNSGDPVSGVFENTRDGDGFAPFFTPEKPGEYRVRFSVDPEFVTVETDEANNEYEVVIKVHEVDTQSGPVAVADQYQTNRRGFVRDNVMKNDWHAEGKAIRIHEFSQPENGRLHLRPNGRFAYRPNPGFNGQDSFTYSITDGQRVSETVEVVLNVRRSLRPWRPHDNAPVAPSHLKSSRPGDGGFAWSQTSPQRSLLSKFVARPPRAATPIGPQLLNAVMNELEPASNNPGTSTSPDATTRNMDRSFGDAERLERGREGGRDETEANGKRGETPGEMAEFSGRRAWASEMDQGETPCAVSRLQRLWYRLTH